MSGITGILNLDGAPVDRGLLTAMTKFMTFRGPDAQRIWIEGNVGFGHTLLRTTVESEHEQQPFTLDGRVWIVADARVDAQEDLIAKLAARGEFTEHGVTDVELLLRAYRVWSEDCLEHLLGDFAFAVWDGPRRRLFCARDQLGVKPFFYADLGATLIFSNTLDCVRQHPAVSDKLNDLAIADFLLFDLNQDPNTTSFADIKRIPPAHRATWSGAGMHKGCYWTLPIDEPIYFKRADDYTDQFKELLDAAVSDRLRMKKIAIFMSGGLDSPALAATACKILRGRLTDSEVHAFTTVIDGYDKNEGYYAGLVAEQLRIPIHFRNRTAPLIDPDWDKTTIHTPEPIASPTNLAADRAEYQTVAAHSRVVLYGEGPDNALLYEWKPYLSHLLRQRRFARLLADIGAHMIRHRRVPLIPTIPRMIKDWTKGPWRLLFPEWFNESFESRMMLRERWGEQERQAAPAARHPVRPAAYRSFHSPLWEALFSQLDAEQTATPFEVRHPFVDLRLLRYMLAVPAIPWCRAKYLERRSMRGQLPLSVLRRPKSPLTGDPIGEAAYKQGVRSLFPVPAIAEYVNFDRVPTDAGLSQVNFRPLALNYWLRHLRRKPLELFKEELDNELVR